MFLDTIPRSDYFRALAFTYALCRVNRRHVDAEAIMLELLAALAQRFKR